jgi:hypothetical protein
MKEKKITRQELASGMLIALTSHTDATVYILGNQHEDTGFVWQLMRHERGMITSCGWADYSSFLHPTKKQLNSIYNAPMIARYQATLTETT